MWFRKLKLLKLKLILIIIGIVVALGLIVAIVTVTAINAKSISKQYNELSNKPTSSARQFKIPFGYVTLNSDGTMNIEFAVTSSSAVVNPTVDDESAEGATPEDDRQNPGEDPKGPGEDDDSGGTGDGDDEYSESDYASTSTSVEMLTDMFSKSDIRKLSDKAYILARVYREVGSVYGPVATIGIMASIVEEGEPGLIQYGGTIKKWDGEHDITSWQSDPYYIGSETNLVATVNTCRVEKNKVGVGIVQWTSRDYFNDDALPAYYRQYCASGYTQGTLLDAEIAYLLKCIKSCKGYPPSSTDVQICAHAWVKKFERPGNADAASKTRKEIALEFQRILTGG